MTTGTHRARIAIATNNGDIGGGEVMLLNIAEALRELDIEVVVIGPSGPGDLVAEGAERGFETIVLPAEGRRAYMLALLRWRLRNRRIPLWCNGLVPSTATAGLGPRIVHLHILPTGLQKVAATIARIGASKILVPSHFMAERIPRSQVLANWTEDLALVRTRDDEGPLRVGFLGRLTQDKGVDVLAAAMREVIATSSRETRLVLAGENRFGTADDDRAISQELARIAESVDRIGWVERETFFAGVDLAVFPSVWPEPFGLVAAEAMAAGVPFVITDAGALSEVAGRDHPWIARAGDARSLSATIISALDAKRERTATVRDARRRWEQEFSPAAGRRRVAELLTQLPDLPRRPAGGVHPIDPTHPQETSR